MNELVEQFELTRQHARHLGNRRLVFITWRARRALTRDALNEVLQVRLIALEFELRLRGRLQASGFPRRQTADIDDM
jgi:hypothetical protein